MWFWAEGSVTGLPLKMLWLDEQRHSKQLGYGPVAQDTGSKKKKKKVHAPLSCCFFSIHMAGPWCKGTYIMLNASLPFLAGENTQCCQVESTIAVNDTLMESTAVVQLPCTVYRGGALRQNKREDNNLREVMWSHVSYPGLLYEAARWWWSWCTRRSLPQVKRCQRGPHISSSWWAS